MNFSNIKTLQIPEGVVTKITTSNGVVLWQAEEEPIGHLAFIARNTGTFNFTGTTNGTNTNEIQYSTDNGSTWSAPSSNVTINVNSGDKVLWKGEMVPYNISNNIGIGNFSSSTASFDIEGNIMSLLYKNNFIGQTDLTGKDYVFQNLFKNTNCVDTENLILAATTLSVSCYFCMFNSCTNLTTAPVLPATILKGTCYAGMFQACSSLTIPPVLPATTLDTECYLSMFNGCTSLTTAPVLPATTIYRNCYDQMFNGCTSLTTAPVLPATTLLNYCYNRMFRNSIQINYIKMLATDISANNCLNNWVSGVAATGIFVKNIDATWTTTGASGVPTGWTVIYYDTTDDKYYLDQQKSQECDDHGNPITTDYSQQPFTIVAKESGTITMYGGTYEHYDSVEDTTEMAWYEFEQSTDEGQTWTAVPYEPDDGQSYITLSVSADDRIMLRCNAAALADDTDNSGFEYTSVLMFDGSNSSEYEVEGNIMSLIYGSNFIGKTELAYTSQITGQTTNFMGFGMFESNDGLLSAENLILPSTVLYDSIYGSMFANCSSLTAAPALPATTLADYCYMSMFDNCTSLTTAPALPATTLAVGCYMSMFSNCESLNYITMLATDISASDCLTGWLNSVSQTGTFVKAASMTSLPVDSGDGIPHGWTVTDAS